MSYRRELPRLFELADFAQSPPSEDAYFFDFDRKLAENCVRLKHFRYIEEELSGLTPGAWDFLKNSVLPVLKIRHVTRGWQAIFDKLNEAKGYNHLVRLGCVDPEFIPPSLVAGQRTPDLIGYRGTENLLCEVKTINISQDEAVRRRSGGVGRTVLQLPDGFFGKLDSDISSARQQLLAFSDPRTVRKVVYVVANFDALLGEYADDYRQQIEAYVSRLPTPDFEIALDIKPPFYAATA